MKTLLTIALSLSVINCQTQSSSKVKDTIIDQGQETKPLATFTTMLGYECSSGQKPVKKRLPEDNPEGLLSCSLNPVLEGTEIFRVNASRRDLKDVKQRLAAMACKRGYSVRDYFSVKCTTDLTKFRTVSGVTWEYVPINFTCQHLWSDTQFACGQSLDMMLVGCQFKKENFIMTEIVDSNGGNTCEISTKIVKQACSRGIDVNNTDRMVCGHRPLPQR